jgi:hypothetical protein
VLVSKRSRSTVQLFFIRLQVTSEGECARILEKPRQPWWSGTTHNRISSIYSNSYLGRKIVDGSKGEKNVSANTSSADPNRGDQNEVNAAILPSWYKLEGSSPLQERSGQLKVRQLPVPACAWLRHMTGLVEWRHQLGGVAPPTWWSGATNLVESCHQLGGVAPPLDPATSLISTVTLWKTLHEYLRVFMSIHEHTGVTMWAHRRTTMCV